jgi:Ca2+-dependent lipid-binding protein
MDLNGFSDPYCQMQIIGDRTFSKTSVKYETLSPYWNESFSFIITNYETDIFNLILRDKDKFSDDDIGSINLQINQYGVGKVYTKWIEVQHKGKKTGLIKVMINVNNTKEKPPLISGSSSPNCSETTSKRSTTRLIKTALWSGLSTS